MLCRVFNPGACSVVEEVMLQESFERISTQILSLYALSKYLATKPELSWQEERNMGASLMLAGLKQENSVGFSAQLLGFALIGKVELSRGIHSVFHEMPLIWTSGYLGRALAVMNAVCDFRDVKLSEEVLDHVEKILQELSLISDGQNDTDTTLEEEDELERQKLPEYMNRFKELKERLVSLDKIDARTLESLVSALAQQRWRPVKTQISLNISRRCATGRPNGSSSFREKERRRRRTKGASKQTVGRCGPVTALLQTESIVCHVYCLWLGRLR
ncbi:hypothetical protein QQF64_031247 [Cirrhinus molitorella]|uniref:Uncharacterized protein n=1 Tax=Cirrhinus molitorella TaxID=172907 RepID=A0ABR3MWD7_9TELE